MKNSEEDLKEHPYSRTFSTQKIEGDVKQKVREVEVKVEASQDLSIKIVCAIIVERKDILKDFAIS